MSSLRRCRRARRNGRSGRRRHFECLEKRRLLAAIDWNGGASGSGAWNVGANWAGGNVPSAADDTAFDIDATYTISLAGNPNITTVRSMTVPTGSPVLDLAGKILVLAPGKDGTGGDLLVGGTQSPAGLYLDNANLLAVNGTAAIGAGAVGVAQAGVSVENGAQLRVKSGITIGTLSGPGELDVVSGSGAQGAITVGVDDKGTLVADGQGSRVGGTLLQIGANGAATAQNNAVVNSTKVVVGSAGFLGTGKMTLQTGATGTADTLAVGVGATGEVNLLTGSSYTVNKAGAVVGDTQNGDLNVSGGSSITFQHGITIGNASFGNVVLDNGSLTVGQGGWPLIVGNAGVGKVKLLNNSTMASDGGFVGKTQQQFFGSSVSIDKTSTWDARGQAVIEGAGSKIWVDGTLKGNVQPQQVPLSPKQFPLAVLGGSGTVAGNVVDPGIVQPGDDPTTGTLTVTGIYEQDSPAALQIGIASATAYDVLAIGGTATLDGTLNASSIGSPDFEPGQKYNVVTSSGLSGQFSNFVPTGSDGGVRYVDVSGGGSLPALPSGLEWEVEYSSTSVTLVIVPTVSIQSNGDI